MILVSNILQTTLPVIYGIAMIFYLLFFFKKREQAATAATFSLSLATVSHMAYSVALGMVLGRHPMATIFEFLSFVAMTMSIIYLFLETLYRNKYMGAFIVPAIFILQFVSSIGFNASTILVPILREVKFALHASMFASAYAAYFLAVLFALMLLLFDRSLKQKKYGIVFEQLPSLSVLIRMTMSTTLVGFGFMTVGLIIGTYNAVNALDGFHLDLKILYTAVVWCMYGFVIFSHFVLRWSDRRSAILNLVGFVLLAIATVAGHFSVSSWHQFVR